MFERGKPWFEERRPGLEAMAHKRLPAPLARLGDAEWLDGPISVGDLMMVTVLRRAAGANLIETYPNLIAYIARREARSAYQRAFADQLAVFKATLPR